MEMQTKRCTWIVYSAFLAVLSFGRLFSSSSAVTGVCWCCISTSEMLKCQHLMNVTSQIESLVSVTCISGGNLASCVRMIANGSADVITLGEEHVYQAGTQHGLVPLVAEDYGKHEEGLISYAVALIKSNLSKDISLETLQNSRACHPAAGDLVGWTAPVGFLIGYGVMQFKDCSPYQSSAAFFQESCVPGALSRKYNPDGNNPINLCGICSNQKSCPRNASEKYYGCHGAYRCLTEGAGDVAFVSHLTVFDFTGINNDLNPGRDFRLLCSDGTRADVGAFQKCNLARIPSRVVMSRPGHKLDSIKRSLLHLDEFFQSNPHLFQTFNSSAYGGKNLLFKDSTVKLIDVKEKNSTEAWLGKKYFLALKALRSCKRVVAAARSLAIKVKSSGTGQLFYIELAMIMFITLRFA